MAEEKITIVDLRKSVARHAGLPEEQVGRFFSALFPEIVEGLKKDKIVRISGLGTFKLIWIEPRKSVNVQTGEPIMLEGYNKLSFIPESFLREQINEPFADLDPQEVDENGVPTQPRSTRNGEDPMKRLGEQAREIKDLLADLGAVVAPAVATATPTEPTVAPATPVVPTTAEEPAVEPVAEPVVEPVVEPAVAPATVEPAAEPVVEVATATPTEPAVAPATAEEPAVVPATPTEPVAAPTEKPFIPSYSSWDEDPEKEKKKKEGKKGGKSLWWLWVLLATILILSGLLVGAYFFGQHIIEKWADKLNGKTELVENVAEQPAEAIEPAELADEEELTAEDSMVLLADGPSKVEPEAKKKSVYEEREYSEFVGIETVKEGSRLTWISKKYYGKKEYWVYIYEANKDVISNPSNVEVGTKLRIPKLPEELTNENDPKAAELAKKLHDEYVKQQ